MFLGRSILSPGRLLHQSIWWKTLLEKEFNTVMLHFTGAPASRGIFTNGASTNLGINSGIFLTSGAGYIVPGPNSSCYAGVNNGYPGNATLNGITTSTTYDAAVLEFDFIPESDTLHFKYVFGSEEYNEWVGTQYNDVFGYFVTGPDPLGGQYNDKNIALIPGTNISVKINSINNGNSGCGVVPTGPGSYSQYYHDNTGGLSLEYDGFTTVLTAFILVVPCQQYHIKLGVADAGDGIYDTGVFIEENSFSSPKIDVQTNPYPVGVSNNMIEGCVEADVVFKLPNVEYAPLTVHFEIQGTADNGIDYNWIPDSVSFAEGVDSAVIHVVPFKDGITEGPETIILIITNTLGCIIRYDTVEFTILDYVNMIDVKSPNTILCEGQQIQLWINTYFGISPYTYEWQPPAADNDTILVSPDTTTTYFINVMDLCMDTLTDSIKVTVFPTPDIDIGPDSLTICEGDTLILNAGGGYLAYVWQNGSTDSTFTVTQAGTYSVTVAGMGGCSTTDAITIAVSSVDVSLGPDTTICIGENVTFDAGPGYASYHWQDNSTNETFIASQTGTYWVQVTNSYGCFAVDSVYLFVDDPSYAVDLGPDKKVCPGTAVTLQPAGIWNSYLWSTGQTSASITVTTPGIYYLYVQGVCGQSSDSIIVSNWPAVNVNLGPDLNLCYGQSTTLEPPSGYTYVWQDNSTFPIYTVYDPGLYYCTATDIHGCTGSDSVYVSVADKVDLGADSMLLCTGQTIWITANSGFAYYDWSNGQSDVQSIEVTEGGKYYVTVGYSYGCETVDSVYVDENPVPEASIKGPDNFCAGESIVLHAPSGPFMYYWNNELGDSITSISEPGTYILKMENVCGDSTAEKTVQELNLPYINLGDKILLFPGESVTLDGGDYESWTWEFNPSLNERYYTIGYNDIKPNDTTISVEVFDGQCKNSDAITIEVYNVEVPIVFTPNGDPYNEKFKPMKDLSGVNSNYIVVFNRWGEKVWESDDFNSGWDGRQNGHLVADGTYFWVLEVYYGNENIKKVYKGSVTVLGTGN